MFEQCVIHAFCVFAVTGFVDFDDSDDFSLFYCLVFQVVFCHDVIDYRVGEKNEFR